MKKLFCLLITVIIMVMMTMVAFAADSSPTSDNIVSDYLTLEFLRTMAGAVAVTTLITQFLKMPLDKVWKVPTRFIVYVIALLILMAVEFFTGDLSGEKIVLILLNAVIVTMASMGTYEITFKKLELKAKTG